MIKSAAQTTKATKLFAFQSVVHSGVPAVQGLKNFRKSHIKPFTAKRVELRSTSRQVNMSVAAISAPVRANP